MGTAYKLCDCKYNDTRLEENLPMNINQELLKLNNKSYSSPLDEDYSLLEKIKRKNASNLIIKTYRKYKNNKSSFEYSYDINAPLMKSVKSNNNLNNLSNNNLNKMNYSSNVSNNNLNISIEKYDSNYKISSQGKNSLKKTIAYIGEKIGNTKSGFGIKLMPNNVKYIGYFKNDKSEGYGKFINENKKDIYYGEFCQDQAKGFGMYQHKNETSYIGEWDNDLRENYGIEKWEDKAEYQGEFHLGEKNGIGKYIFSDGSRYEGEWKKNNLDGYGIYYYLGQRIYIGQWKNNLKDGFGMFIWKDKIYIGFYEDDKKNGFGIYYWKNIKKAFMGFWKNGKQYGFGKLISEKKNKYGIWVNDSLETAYDEEQAFNELEKRKLGRYKYMFLFGLNDVDNYSNEDGIWKSLLDYSNQFTI